MLKRLMTAAVLLPLNSVAYSAGLDISLSNETAALNYVFDSTNIVQGGADISVGVFYNDKESNGVDTDVILGQGKFLVTGNMKGTQKRVKLSAGAKALLGQLDIDAPGVKNKDLGGVAIGGRAAYVIPSQNTPMAAYVEGYIAPKITSFGDSEGYTEFTIGYEAEIAPSAKGYIGYRLMEMEFKNTSGDVELDDNIHLGLLFTF